MELSELRDFARSKADEQSTGFISATELDRFLNQGYRFVRGKIAQRFEDYFIVPGTVGNDGLITTTSGTQAYDLPEGLVKVVRVEWRASSDTNDDNWMRVSRVNIGSDGADGYYPERSGYGYQAGYFVAGNQIFLRPVPTSAFSLRIWFVPSITELSAADDQPEIPSDFHPLIAEYAALQCLRKSGEGIFKESQELFLAELQNLLETIEVRDHQPEQMVITDRWDAC